MVPFTAFLLLPGALSLTAPSSPLETQLAFGLRQAAGPYCRHGRGHARCSLGVRMQQGPPPVRRSASQPELVDSKRPGFDPEMFRYYANPDKFENTQLTITEFPSPILRAVNAKVTTFDDELADLCKQFLSVMYGANGVGLAAPQVGMNIRLFVYNCDPTAPGALKKMGEVVCINPKILEYGPATDVEIEGCLSSRAECCRGDICRATTLQVEYQDEKGRVKRKKLRGFEARVFQHEYDHLEGILHIDRQTAEDRARIQPFLDVMVDSFGPGGVLEPRVDAKERMQPPVDASAPSAAAPLPKPRKPKATAAKPTSAPAKPTTGFGGAAASKKGAAAKKKKKK